MKAKGSQVAGKYHKKAQSVQVVQVIRAKSISIYFAFVFFLLLFFLVGTKRRHQTRVQRCALNCAWHRRFQRVKEATWTQTCQSCSLPLPESFSSAVIASEKGNDITDDSLFAFAKVDL